jgi:microcompartment protein CcmL/EutN
MEKVKSIGLIETLGMVGAVEAADAATKAANVRLLGYEFNRAGYVMIKLTGDVAAVKAAVSSGGATAARLGNLIATHVIARPDEQLVDVFINSADNFPQVKDEDEKAVEKESSVTGGAASSGTEGSQRGAIKQAVPKQTQQTPKKSSKPATKSSESTPQAKPSTPQEKPGKVDSSPTKPDEPEKK